MTVQCRTCGGVIYNKRPKNLFSVENATMLLNLIQVTGAVIVNNPELPSCICGCCLHDLKLALVFRERCLQTQKNLLERGKSPKREAPEPETDFQEEEEECEVPVEKTKCNGLSPIPVEDDSPEPVDDDFFDEFEASLDVEEEPAKADEEPDTLDTNEPEEFQTIYDSNSDVEEFHGRISEHESDVDCYTDSSCSASPRQPASVKLKSRTQNTDDLQKISENEGETEEDSATDSSSPVSPRQPASMKTRQRGRPRASTAKPGSGDLQPKATSAKPKKKKQYVTWKNMTEEQIVERKRQQRMRDCVCEQCGRHFTDQSNFKLHMLRHTGVRNFACEECGKRFYTDHLLSLHQRIVHKGERPYACRFCPKSFHNSTTRVIHERIHTNARPYQCTHCNKTFSSASGRKRHELIHTGVRAYSCTICEQSFQRNTHLKAHLRSKMHVIRAESVAIQEEVESERKLN